MFSQQQNTDATIKLLEKGMFYCGDEDVPDAADGADGAGLEDAVKDEREYLRGRLRGELGREPSEDELNEWLRRHTEGY
ncbi:MAG TPA: hypothetical protein VF666_13425 [Pyrinomonadaceae bacterium]|jgi:hypothetical protein